MTKKNTLTQSDWLKWGLGVVVLVVSSFIGYTFKLMDNKAEREDVKELQVSMENKVTQKDLGQVENKVDEMRKDQKDNNDRIIQLQTEQHGIEKEVEGVDRKLDKILDNLQQRKR